MQRVGRVVLMAAVFFFGFASSVTAASLWPPRDWTEERWYTVDYEETPFVSGSMSGRKGGERWWEAGYYWNDQTFFNVGHSQWETVVSGSYRWDSGFFLGLSYEDEHRWNEAKIWTINPGYRWELDRGHIVLSLDYGRQHPDNIPPEVDYRDETKGVELLSAYYPENMKIQGFLRWECKDNSITSQLEDLSLNRWDKEMLSALSVNYRVKEDLVVGFRGYYGDMSTEVRVRVEELDVQMKDGNYYYGYGLGFTWDPTFLVLNGALEKNRDYDALRAGVFIPLPKDFTLGYEYAYRDYGSFSDNEDRVYSLKYRYREDSAFILEYQHENQQWALVYQRDL